MDQVPTTEQASLGDLSPTQLVSYQYVGRSGQAGIIVTGLVTPQELAW